MIYSFPMKTEVKRPKISSYQDYRILLKDFATYLKSNDLRYSLEFISRKIGISHSFLKQIITRKKHINLNKIPKIFQILNLSLEEQQFFTYLVCSNQIHSKEVKIWFDRSIEILKDNLEQNDRGDKMKNNFVDPNLFSRSLKPIIYVMCSLPGFQADPDWIRSQLRDKSISKNEIKICLDELIKSGSLKLDENGNWISTGLALSRPEAAGEFGSIVSNALYRGLNASQNLVTFKPANHNILTLTLTDGDFGKIEKILGSTRDQLLDLKRPGTPSWIGRVILYTYCEASLPDAKPISD